MSNVLVGIIGVILFIGLALAGALFLGPRFQEASNNSKASAAVQAVKQVRDAADMYALQEGKPFPQGPAQGLVDAGYLKFVPVSPVTEGGTVGVYGGVNDPGAALRLPAGSEAICRAVNKQTFGSEEIATGYNPRGGLVQCIRYFEDDDDMYVIAF